MTGRGTLYLLLTVVAGAAAMLSFAGLRDLALLCGFAHALAWLLPVVVDVGAAAGSLVWLGPAAGAQARRFARRLALGLLGLSVAANALGHGLAAYQLAPPWWVVVVLSGIAPAVLGAMVHLAVLVGYIDPADAGGDLGDSWPDRDGEPIPYELIRGPDGVAALDEGGLRHQCDDAPATSVRAAAGPAPVGPLDRASALIAAGAGRRRLSRELDITEYEARRLLDQARTSTDTPTDDTAEAADAPALAPSGASS